MILGGTITLCAPAVGILRGVIKMQSAFKTLGSSGVASPDVLSVLIGEALMTSASGIFIGLLAGLFILLPALIIWFSTRKKSSAQTNV